MRKIKTLALCMTVGLMLLGGCGKTDAVSDGTTETPIQEDTYQEEVSTEYTDTEETTVENTSSGEDTESDETTDGGERETDEMTDGGETETVETADDGNTESDETVDDEDTESVEIPRVDVNKPLEPIDAENSYDAYKEALRIIMTEQRIPNGMELGAPFDDVSTNVFAIADVDLDGRDELIVSWNDTTMAGMILFVFDYSKDNRDLTLELAEFPSACFYDNGIVIVEWSHNQGLGGAKLWPYTFFTYQPSVDEYYNSGYVDSWDKETFAEDFEGNPYPDDVDKDGIGTVYSIYDGDAYTGSFVYCQADYDVFLADLIGDANEIILDWKNLTEENINSIN